MLAAGRSPSSLFMIPLDIDNITSTDRTSLSRFQKLAEKFHYSTTRFSAAHSSPHPQCHSNSYQPSYLADSILPPPGPAHYVARQVLWLTPTKVAEHSSSSSSRLRLEQLLNQPGAVYSDEAWKGGVEKVWKGLIGGGKLRRRLPMNLVIKVIHAGWLRDPETWPSGAAVPESDDEAPHNEPPPRAISKLTSRQEIRPEDKPSTRHLQDAGEMCSSVLLTTIKRVGATPPIKE